MEEPSGRKRSMQKTAVLQCTECGQRDRDAGARGHRDGAFAPAVPGTGGHGTHHPVRAASEEGYYAEFDPARLGGLGVPTLVLVIGESPAFEKVAAEALE